MKLLILLLLFSCGKQKIEAEVNDSNHTITGTTTSELIIKFEPLLTINQLCKDLYLPGDFDSEILYNQKVAECTFEKLSIIDFGTLTDFNNNLCDTNVNYDTLTPEEKAQVDQLCSLI